MLSLKGFFQTIRFPYYFYRDGFLTCGYSWYVIEATNTLLNSSTNHIKNKERYKIEFEIRKENVEWIFWAPVQYNQNWSMREGVNDNSY